VLLLDCPPGLGIGPSRRLVLPPVSLRHCASRKRSGGADSRRSSQSRNSGGGMTRSPVKLMARAGLWERA